MRRSDGSAGPAGGDPVAAESVLGLPEVRPSLLDDLPHAARRRGRRPASRSCDSGTGYGSTRGSAATSTTGKTRSPITSRQARHEYQSQ